MSLIKTSRLAGASSSYSTGEVEVQKNLPPGGVLAILREWAVKEDAPQIVRESCQIAIDMWEVSGLSLADEL